MQKTAKWMVVAAMLPCAAVWGQPAKKPPEAKPAEAKPAEAKPAEAKPAPGGEMAMKPPAELQQLQGMVGSWKCQGKGTMMGKEMKSTGTYKVSWDLGKYWLVGQNTAKAEGMPGTMKGTDYYGYDPGSKMFVDIGFDSMGGWAMARSKGWEGDTQEWSGKGTMMGKETDVKWTVTRKGDKEVHLAGSAGGDTWEATCKK